MTTVQVELYGEGGLAGKGLLDSWEETFEETEAEKAQREFRDAVNNASTLDDLKAAILGTNISGASEVRPT